MGSGVSTCPRSSEIWSGRPAWERGSLLLSQSSVAEADADWVNPLFHQTKGQAVTNRTALLWTRLRAHKKYLFVGRRLDREPVVPQPASHTRLRW